MSGESALSILLVRSCFKRHTPDNHVHLEGIPPRTSSPQNAIAMCDQGCAVELGNSDADRQYDRNDDRVQRSRYISPSGSLLSDDCLYLRPQAARIYYTNSSYKTA